MPGGSRKGAERNVCVCVFEQGEGGGKDRFRRKLAAGAELGSFGTELEFLGVVEKERTRAGVGCGTSGGS